MNLLKRYDNKLALKVQNWPDGLYRLMWAGSWLGDPVMLLSTALASFSIALSRGDYNTARAFVWAVFSFSLVGVLKVALMKPRPNNHYATSMWIGGYSFPSGHAFGSLAIYGLLACLAYQHLTRPAGCTIAGLAAGAIVIIGLSRVYLGAHYPRDILGGWILGGVSLLLIVRLVLS